MFWEKEYKPKDFGLELEETEFSCGIESVDEWFKAGLFIAEKYNMTDIEQNSLIYFLTTFFGGLGISAGTEYYIKEHNLELHLVDISNDFKNDFNEKEAARKFIGYVINLYRFEIEDWTRRDARLDMRCSTNLRLKLDEIDGETNLQKVNFLLNYYRDHKKE